MKKTLITGSLAFDFIMDFPGTFEENIDPTKLHIMSVSFLVKSLKREKGGTAGNIAYSMGLLGQNPSILGATGDDFDSYSAYLKSSGIDTSTIKSYPNESSSIAMIITDQKDNQITAFYPGAMTKNVDLSLNELKEKPDFLVISPNDPAAILKFAKEAQELSIPAMIDIGMQLPSLEKEQIIKIIKGAQILIGNDYEIGLLTKKTGLSEQDLLKEVEILITTLGEKGSEIKTKSESIKVKAAKPKEVLDPTGAGDSFRSGFLAGFLNGLDLKTSAQMGSITSCYVVEKYGTTNHSFNLKEFCQRYKDNFGEDLNL